MSDSFLMKISSRLPFSDAQYDGLLQLLEHMDNERDAMLIEVPNHADFDDFMAVYLEWREYGYHVELDFPMDDFGWKYPLVLACDLSTKGSEKLLRELLVDVTGSGESDVVSNRFRRVKAGRYGEKEAKEYSK